MKSVSQGFLEEHFLSWRIDLGENWLRRGFLRSGTCPLLQKKVKAQRGENEEMSEAKQWESRAPASIHALLEARKMSMTLRLKLGWSMLDTAKFAFSTCTTK